MAQPQSRQTGSHTSTPHGQGRLRRTTHTRSPRRSNATHHTHTLLYAPGLSKAVPLHGQRSTRPARLDTAYLTNPLCRSTHPRCAGRRYHAAAVRTIDTGLIIGTSFFTPRRNVRTGEDVDARINSSARYTRLPARWCSLHLQNGLRFVFRSCFDFLQHTGTQPPQRPRPPCAHNSSSASSNQLSSSSE